MASQIAQKIYQLQWGQIDVIDAELQEVREVLEGLQTFQMNLGSEGTERHWCQTSGGCNAHCQRARDLMQKLKVE